MLLVPDAAYRLAGGTSSYGEHDMKPVETIYGRRSKYEIYRVEQLLWPSTFHIHRDGKKVWSTPTLRAAVDWVEREG